MLKRIAIVLLIILICCLVYVGLSDINLLSISGNSKKNYYPYLRISISIILSILILLSIKKKYTAYYFLNLLWIIPIMIIIFKNIFGFYNTEKLDYLLGENVKNYNIKQYEDHTWIINMIILKNANKVDTIYVSENPSWEKKSYQLNDKKQSKIVRSWITGYYYVSVK